MHFVDADKLKTRTEGLNNKPLCSRAVFSYSGMKKLPQSRTRSKEGVKRNFDETFVAKLST